VVIIAPLAVVVVVVTTALQEAVVLLLLLVCPLLHHVMESCDGLGVIAAKILVEELVANAVVESVDDVLFRDVGDGGTRLKEIAGVLAQGLATFLFALGQVVTSIYSSG
jgi:hypothetical protein